MPADQSSGPAIRATPAASRMAPAHRVVGAAASTVAVTGAAEVVVISRPSRSVPPTVGDTGSLSAGPLFAPPPGRPDLAPPGGGGDRPRDSPSWRIPRSGTGPYCVRHGSAAGA